MGNHLVTMAGSVPCLSYQTCELLSMVSPLGIIEQSQLLIGIQSAALF